MEYRWRVERDREIESKTVEVYTVTSLQVNVEKGWDQGRMLD